MKSTSRLVLSLASLGLIAAACGGSEAVERPPITATPTTAVPVTEPEPEPETTEAAPTDEADDEEPAATDDDAETEAAGEDSTDGEDADGDAAADDDAEAAPANPALIEVAKSQLLAQGYSEEDADCLANNLDYNDPLVIAQDPEALAPTFEACGVDIDAEPGS